MMVLWDTENVRERELIQINYQVMFDMHTGFSLNISRTYYRCLCSTLWLSLCLSLYTHQIQYTKCKIHTHRCLTLRSSGGPHELQDDIFHLEYLWIVTMPNMNSISSTWSHQPFGGNMAPASRCPFVKMYITSVNCKKKNCISLLTWDSIAGVAHTALKDPFCQCPGALCDLTLPLSLPPTLSSWCGLSDITTDTWQRELAARYRSLTFLCLLQLYLSASFLAWHMVSGAKSAKWPLEKHKFVNVDWAVISSSL